MGKGIAIFIECLCGLAAFFIAVFLVPNVGNGVMAGVLGTIAVEVGIGAFVAAALIGSD